MGEIPFEKRFPRLFKIEKNENCKVFDILKVRGGFWEWKRDMREGRTKEEFHSLKATVESVVLNEKKDVWNCSGGPKGSFLVGWFRNEIAKKNQQVIGKNFWSKWIPNKVNIFIWKLFRRRVAVKEVLSKMGIVQHSNVCEVCKQEVESIKHVFIKCPIAQQVWNDIGDWWGLNMINMGDLEEIIEYLSIGQNQKHRKVLELVGFATLQLLWRNRNDCIFNNKSRNGVDILAQIQREVFLWIHNRANKVAIDSLIWLSNPRLAVQNL